MRKYVEPGMLINKYLDIAKKFGNHCKRTIEKRVIQKSLLSYQIAEN